MKVLFIGGPKDGLRQEWPSFQTLSTQYAQLTPPGARTFPTLDPNGVSLGITTHTCHLKKFITKAGKELVVAVDSPVPDVMEALVKGYRYHRNPRGIRSRIRRKLCGQPPWNVNELRNHGRVQPQP